VTAHIAGALAVTFAVVAYAEPARAVRFLNVLIGLGMLIAPRVLTGVSQDWLWASTAGGLALIAFSLPRGAVSDRYGGFDRYIV
jgi:hypothetical protein